LGEIQIEISAKLWYVFKNLTEKNLFLERKQERKGQGLACLERPSLIENNGRYQ
jgi:hypothetical protein